MVALSRANTDLSLPVTRSTPLTLPASSLSLICCKLLIQSPFACNMHVVSRVKLPVGTYILVFLINTSIAVVHLEWINKNGRTLDRERTRVRGHRRRQCKCTDSRPSVRGRVAGRPPGGDSSNDVVARHLWPPSPLINGHGALEKISRPFAKKPQKGTVIPRSVGVFLHSYQVVFFFLHFFSFSEYFCIDSKDS